MATKGKRLTYNPLDLLVSDEGPADGPTLELDPALIAPNPHQPRQHYDPDEQAQLEASMRDSGLHQPLLVRRLPDGSYQLVAGSRRLAAAQSLDLPTVPVVVRDYTDEQAEQVALLENLQRANLRFGEEARALLRLKRRYRLTNEALGRSIGKSTDYVELRIAAAEHPEVLDLYMQGTIEQKEIRAAIRSREAGGAGDPTPNAAPLPDSDKLQVENGSTADTPHPNASDSGPLRAGRRPGRRPPDGWRWATNAEQRLQQLPQRASRMDSQERQRARDFLQRLRSAADQALQRLDEHAG